MPEVKCSVASCVYWDTGNNCGADAIMVEIDEHADRKFQETINGEPVDTTHQDYSAKQSAETCCHTFKPKH
ncbi:MAG: DUF1540 domain-containing protein [Firmicutes bacterium]|uniref:DUF1540 domain-containing protein n=1 Tax=Melghirimyces thermohalophilus TaxID=1236220 RepID=A0A1G6HMM7_9BACL|nr:DUF1540 domain-containing protein [Melghirimyces thermohalophilus]MDA8354393.1 DUF1540 domain-containing protein [Bacillota bacterium]SDB94696.1 protein of unknown function [Melghirimyces thermohalophilus]